MRASRRKPDPQCQRANEIAHELGAVLEDGRITVGIGLTALSVVTGVVISQVDDSEFEVLLKSFIGAVLSHRAFLLTPPAGKLN